MQETLSMTPHPGLQHSPEQVCCLKRALYGLKQPPCAWFKKFYMTNLKFKFTQSFVDPALFICYSSASDVFFLLYIDDMILTENDVIGIQATQSFLTLTFEMTDLGPLVQGLTRE